MVVLDAVLEHDAAVELGGERASRARSVGSSAATAARTASAVEVAARVCASGQLVAQEARALRERLRMREHDARVGGVRRRRGAISA